MTPALFTLTLIATVSVALSSGLDNNPKNAGETQSRNSAGTVLDGATGNPALVGLDTRPRGGLLLFPLSLTLWSDKLAPPLELNTLINPVNPSRAYASYITKFIRKSFDIENGINDLDEVSRKLTEELKGGISVYTGTKVSPFVFATRGFGLSVSTFADADVIIPGGLLMPFFSATDGLQTGQGLDLSEMHLSAIAATEIAVKLGYSTTVPFIRDHLGFNKGAAGVGIKLLLGHSYFDAKMKDGSTVSYDPESNKYNVNAQLDILSAGTGLYDDFKYKDNYFINNPVNGYGLGFDIGTVFRNNNHALSADVQNFGMIIWGKDVHKGSLSFEPDSAFKNGFDLNDLQLGATGLFKDPGGTLTPSNENYFMWLPAALNLGYSYNLRFRGALNVFLGYLTASMGYNQQLMLGIGHNSYMPRFSAGTTIGLLAGHLPVRYGLAYGGPQMLTSAAGAGLDVRYFSIDAFYKAVGSPALIPARGFEVGSALTVSWGWRRKKVRDIPETAPPEPEAEPTDTAPEPVAPAEPGPPPNEDEQAEVYKPIEINLTSLPPPPPPPPPPQQPTAEETQALTVSQRAINFMPGNATLTEGSYAPLNAIAELLKQYPNIRYEVQGHTDSQGAEMHNLLLSAERAAVVKYYLMSRGAPETSLVAVGYGKNIPIADNNTVTGRALNRRVEFVQIQSQEHYDYVKKFELEMIPRLTDRIINWRAILEPKSDE